MAGFGWYVFLKIKILIENIFPTLKAFKLAFKEYFFFQKNLHKIISFEMQF